MAFNFQINQNDSGVNIDFAGTLDEHSELPKIPEVPTVRVNLEALVHINSVGVRKWTRWMQEIPASTQLVIANCPVLFVKNLSSIRGMLTKNTTVESFYVPFYQELSGERKNVLFQRNKDFGDQGLLNVPVIEDSKARPMEIDVIEESYFAFLKR